MTNHRLSIEDPTRPDSSQSIRDCENQFRKLVEGIALTVWETDANGITVVDSPSWRALTGQSLEQTLQSRWLDAVHPEDKEYASQLWLSCIRDGNVFNAEYRLKHRDGRWIWVQAHAVPICDDNKNVLKWVGMHFDITERKQSEQRLVMSERQMQLALDISRMSFYNFDTVKNVVEMDARMRAIWGEPGDEDYVPIERVMARIHPEDRDLVWRSVNNALDPNGTGIYLPNDYRLVLDDGSIRWVSANGTTLFSGRGTERTAVQMFGTVIDITERKAIEDSLRDSEERLQQLNAQLEDRVRERTRDLVKSEQELRAAAELAEQVNRQLRRLTLELSRTEEKERRRLAQVLHDHLQQLLVAAKMRIEGLSKDTKESETQERLTGIATVIDLAIDSTRNLAVELVPPILHSQGLPAALNWLAAWTHERHPITVDVSADTTANPRDEETRGLLFHAAREFLLNTIKHAKVDRATVKLAIEEDMISLCVTDQGVGFDPRIVWADASSFGLFHFRERILAIGGQLIVLSQPNNGTCITVRVPR